MSQAVLIKGPDDNIALVDKVSKSIHVASIIQQMMHAGRLFAVSIVSKGVTNGTAVNILLRTVGKPVHASLRMTATGTADLAVFEAPTTTADGVALPVIARNRAKILTSGVLLFAAPTITADGLQLLDEIVPPSGERKISELLADESILAPNTDYLLRLSNTSGGNIDVGLVFDFFESLTSDFD